MSSPPPVPETRREPPAGTAVGSYFVANYPPFSFWRPDAVGEARSALEAPPPPGVPIGLYLHIPFCRLRCKFCYFRVYTEKNAREVEDYLEALAREVELLAEVPAVRGRPLRFVYFGGGTPSYLSTTQLHALVERIKKVLPWDAAEEVTFECEPGTLTRKKLEVVKELGVTRLSLGVESFDDSLLEMNGRAHRSPEVFRAYREAREVGFPQINIDLIAGMVGETDAGWRESVRKAAELAPESITIYQMELPWNTEISREILKGAAPVSPVAGWDTKRRWVEEAFQDLERAGYRVSSGYTLVRSAGTAGAPARFVYRDSLWRGADMLGTGVASFSYVGGVHFQNDDRFESYIARLGRGELPLSRAYRTDAEERLIRELALQLKLGEVDAGWFRAKFGVEVRERFAPVLEDLRGRGLLEAGGGDRIALTRAGLLRVDELLPALFLPRHRGARYT